MLYRGKFDDRGWSRSMVGMVRIGELECAGIGDLGNIGENAYHATVEVFIVSSGPRSRSIPVPHEI